MSEDQGAQRDKSDAATKMVGGFEVLSEIGRGAMGAVFKARQVSVDRIVALKILPPRLAKNENFISRFLREARSVAHLNHPNIVQAIDAGHAGVYYYFAMEYVDGPTADALLQSEGPLPERRALEIARDVARALQHAHESDIVHRDVKPDNILIGSDGAAKLADLGLARETVELDSRLTQTGMAVGTPDYISPEQARGEVELDGRTDVYSLGATLYNLLAGAPPYDGESPVEIMYKHMHEPLPDPRNVNPNVSVAASAIILKAMAKDRSDRYQSASAMLKDIESLLVRRKATPLPPVAGRVTGSIVTRATMEMPAARAGKAKSRKGIYVGVGAAAGALLLVILGVVLWPERDGRAPGPAPGAVTSEPGKVAGPSSDEELLAYASDWLKEHPGDYRGAIQAHERAIGEFKRPVFRLKAEEAVKELRRQRGVAADTAFADVEKQANVLATSGDYDAAIAEYAKVPGRLSDLLSDRTKGAASLLRSAVETRIRSAMVAAQKLCDEDEPLKGIGELDKVAGIRYASLDAEVTKLRDDLVEASKDIQAYRRKKALAKAKGLVTDLLGKIESAANEGDVAEVDRLISAARKDDTFKPVEAELKSVAVVGKALGRAVALRRVGPADVLKPLVGRDVTLRTKRGRVRRGELKEVTADSAVLVRTFKISGRDITRRYHIKIADIAPESIDKLRAKWQPKTPDDHIAAAILAVADKDAARLEALLKGCEGHPLHARYASARISSPEYVAVERLLTEIEEAVARRNLPKAGRLTQAAVKDKTLGLDNREHASIAAVGRHLANLGDPVFLAEAVARYVGQVRSFVTSEARFHGKVVAVRDGTIVGDQAWTRGSEKGV